MKVRCVLLVVLLLLAVLTACSPGHLGNNVIAFIRAGQLWTIDPDGANAFAIVGEGAPVVGYNWSPNHQIVAFRTLDTDFARSPAAKRLSSDPVTGLIGDTPATLNTVGIDGGTPINTAFSSPDIRYSNLIWSPGGTRLLYRQTALTNPRAPDEASWVIAQNDQPGGIAAKSLPGTYAIPSLSYNTQKTIGISRNGIFTTSFAGVDLHSLTHGLLTGHPLSAPLERVLWQPAHQDTHILYAVSVSRQETNNAATPTIQLIMQTTNGQISILTSCTCTQFAWSPDGNAVLYSTGTSYTVLNINNKIAFSISSEVNSVPYWSPDSKFLLLDGIHTLTMAQIAEQKSSVLLSDSNIESGKTFPIVPTPNTLLQPVANSIWATDSRHFLFLTHDRLRWQGKALSSGKGLYTVSIDDHGQIQDTPTVVDTGNDTQAGWSYQDANTSFLY